MKVAILGATGETGRSIVNGLLESTEPRYEVIALTRPSSLEKPAVRQLAQRGVEVIAADLDGPLDELTKLLKGVDTVISAINAANLPAQIPLVDASKAAGVARFVPCFFATVVPPKGVLKLRDLKEDVLNHIKKSYVPYTAIDIGWWYQIALPRLPSGRIDYANAPMLDDIPGDGNTPSALTDTRDIGKYVARIISDPRTLNRPVFAYNALYTQNEIYDLLEKLSGESVGRKYISREAVEAGVAETEASQAGPDSPEFYKLAQWQYWNSWGIRGDNTPEYAKYLGYLVAKDLYPDLEGRSLESFIQEVLEGKGRKVYT
ncbi:hypothetical protein FDECE_12245 [Fusarium decemcellulare]|nr:hypothetical protein FDECE_12245 [Fusarium decemcellulare]